VEVPRSCTAFPAVPISAAGFRTASSSAYAL